MPSLSDDNINIKIATTADNRGIDESSASFAKMAGAFAAGQAVFALASSAIHKITDEAASVVTQTEDWTKSTVKLQREMGVSAETASSLLAVTQRFGVDGDAASKSFGILAKQVTAAAGGSQSAIDNFKHFGVVVTDNHGKAKDFNTVFGELADKFHDAPAGMDKTAEAMKLFGKSGKDMLPILNLGSAGIADLEAKAKSMGLVLTQNNVDSVRKLIGAQKDWNEQLEGIKIQLGLHIIPKLTEMAQWITGKGVPAAEAFAKKLEPIWKAMENIGKQIEQYLQPKLKDLWKAIEGLYQPFSKFVKEYVEPLAKAFYGAEGKAIVWVIGATIDILKELIKVATPVFQFLDDHRNVVYLLAGAFTALKVEMALGAAFDAIKVAFVVFQTVQVPSMMATLSTLGAAFWAAFPLAAIAAAAIIAFEKIQAAAKATLKVMDATRQAIVSASNSDDDAIKTIEASFKAGKISKAQEMKMINDITGARAAGGPVAAGQAYLVGDNPDGSINSTTELFVPGQSGTIIPANKTRDLLNGGTTNNRNVTIGTVVLQNDSAARSFWDGLDRDSRLVSQGLTPSRGF